MLITQKINITLNSSDIAWYEDLGYIIPRYKDNKGRMLVRRGTQIEVNNTDLIKSSHVKVKVKCDYCDTRKEVSYRDYLKGHDEELGDCCIKCRPIKYKNTMNILYGVNNSSQIPETRNKIITTNQQRYGCDWHTQSTVSKEKFRQTMLEKYGVEHALQVPEIASKMMKTRCDNHNNPTSKPQENLSKILKEIYGNCQLEVPCDRCSLDCLIEVDSIKIDVEYDGWYWHQDDYRDRRRDNFVKNNGYKILRVKANKKDDLPTVEQIKEKVNRLLSGYDYTEITM